MRNYFITGGTGFVGRALVREILAQPDTAQVVCLTRKLRANMLQDDRLSYWVGDVTSAKFPTMPFTDVVHAAAEAALCTKLRTCAACATTRAAACAATSTQTTARVGSQPY